MTSLSSLEGKKLEDYLVERHDLTERTKTQYRMAFQALKKYTDAPYNLNRKNMNRVLEALAKDYSAGSWNTYVMCIRAVYKWRGLTAAVEHLKFKRIRRADYIKTKILSEQEIKNMLRSAESPRDRAFIAVLAATGARRGEMLGLQLRDVQVRPYGYDLVLTGKTGTHPSPPIVLSYAKILRVWLEHHPRRDDPDAPLWTKRKGGSLEGIRRVQAHNIVKKAAAAAGIKRNVHMHMFRHTENTLLTKRHVPAAARKKLHGWSPTSNTPSIYEHLTDGDAVEAVLRGHGIMKPVESLAADNMKPVECGYCHELNPSGNKYCSFCGIPLDTEAAAKMVEREKKRDLLASRVAELEQGYEKLLQLVLTNSPKNHKVEMQV